MSTVYQKIGEMLVGGESGNRIELWVNNETFVDPVDGLTKRYIGAKEMVFTADPSDIMGVRCFGRIIDRKANYEARPIFPSNWEKQGDPVVEYLTAKSAPLFVPVNANATAKATVL